jgi:pimeloyl-ACP methyl ester carboxylesterase
MTAAEAKKFSIRSFVQMAKNVMLIGFLILAAAILLLGVTLLLWSPGRQIPFTDANGHPLTGSISEKIRVEINGVEQGMFIKSKDENHPVLLYLHGGMPDYFMTQRYPIGLEEIFTVVWWEQRGAGLSYSPDIPPESLTLEQLISDTLAVTNYLRARFGQEKIYLMGHSGGTFIGIQAAARAPELYHAYIGVAQITDQLRSEQLAQEYMLTQFQANGNTKMVERLAAAPVTRIGGTPDAYLAVRDEAMHTLGIGTTRDMRSILTGIFLPTWQHPEYTLGEKINLWRGKFQSGASILWDTMLTTDLAKQVPKLEIPVYFFHGVYDYTCSYPLALTYFENLAAPQKGFYSFTESAHSPIFEEPEKTLKILREDVLRGARNLADGTNADSK